MRGVPRTPRLYHHPLPDGASDRRQRGLEDVDSELRSHVLETALGRSAPQELSEALRLLSSPSLLSEITQYQVAMRAADGSLTVRGTGTAGCDARSLDRQRSYSGSRTIAARAASGTGAAPRAVRTAALLYRGLTLLPGPLGRGRRALLLRPGVTVAQHRHVRVPTGDGAEHERGPRAVARRHVAGPVRRGERELLLAGGASLP